MGLFSILFGEKEDEEIVKLRNNLKGKKRL
jgi:hypothetical protein